MKKTFFTIALAALGALAGVSTAQAGFIRNTLVSGENVYEDLSREALVDVNGNGKYDKGDVLVGFVRIDQHATTGTPSNNACYAIFTQQVKSIVTLASAPGFVRSFVEFQHTTAAGLTLKDLTGSTTDGIVAIYDSIGAAFSKNLTTTSPGNLTGSATVNLFDYLKLILNEGTRQIVAGISHADDKFTAETVDYKVGGTSDFVSNLNRLNTTPVAGTLANFRAGLTILENNIAGITFNELIDVGLGGTHDLGIANGAVRRTKNTTNNGLFNKINPDLAYKNQGGFVDDADFFVNATVPEPTSIVVFGLGLIGLGYSRLRRRA